MKLIERVKLIIEVSGVAGITRRYLVFNFFDGAMVGLGLILGLYLSGVKAYEVALFSTLSVILATATSGFTGALVSERIEQELRLRRLEAATLRDLRGSLHESASRLGPIIVATVNSLSAILSTFLTTLPFLLSLAGFMSSDVGAALSIIMSLALLNVLGTILSKSLGVKWTLLTARLVIAGVVAATLILLSSYLLRL